MTQYWFIAVNVAFFLAVVTSEAAQKVGDKEIAFVEKAAREQLGEIALGRLAMKKASDKKVKELGAEIVEDHQYASEELKEVSAQEEIYLPVEMDAQQKKTYQRLSRLSGNEFDRAFVAYLLKKHRKDMDELRNHAAKLRNENVRQWAETTEPIMAVHLNKAEYVADALGMNEAKSAAATE